MVVVVFFSVVDATFGATVRDATLGAAAVLDASVVLGLAATFDAADVAVAVAVGLRIGGTLPLVSGFFASVGLALGEAAVLVALTAVAATMAVVAATAAAATATSLTKFSSTNGSGSDAAAAVSATATVSGVGVNSCAGSGCAITISATGF